MTKQKWFPALSKDHIVEWDSKQKITEGRVIKGTKTIKQLLKEDIDASEMTKSKKDKAKDFYEIKSGD